MNGWINRKLGINVSLIFTGCFIIVISVACYISAGLKITDLELYLFLICLMYLFRVELVSILVKDSTIAVLCVLKAVFT